MKMPIYYIIFYVSIEPNFLFFFRFSAVSSSLYVCTRIDSETERTSIDYPSGLSARCPLALSARRAIGPVFVSNTN